MDVAVDRKGAARPLELLGISDTEERAYRALLERHMATAAEIAGILGITLRISRKLLADLETLGLATHTPKVPRVYVAAPPEFAVTALVRRQQARLEQVRVAIPELEVESARAGHANGHEPVLELITNDAHLGVVMTQMYESYRKEVMCFQRAPFLTPSVSPPHKLRPGGQVRTISDTSILEIPGALARIRKDVARGEQARMLPMLPFKMMIFDRRVAVVSPDGQLPEKTPTLLIHGNVLLKVLCLLFEFVWDRATPIVSSRAEKLKTGLGDALPGELADALIPLLAAGLNDKAIAAELGISPATLNRRMSELMRASDARTRFQLGWCAALAAASSRDLQPE